VDLVLPDALASDDERAAVDGVLGAASSGWSGGERTEADGRVARGGHEARGQRHLLLPVLHALQSSAGWISPGGLRYACERLTVPPAEAYGVATFYAMFAVEPRPTTVLHLCDDIACKVAGAEGLIEDVVGEVGPEQVLRSPCLGMCERAPAALLQTGDSNDVAFGPVSIDRLEPFIRGGPRMMMSGPEAGEVAPQTDGTRDGLRLLSRVGVVDPTSLDDYRAHGGYEALRRAVELGPEGVIRELKDSKLLGRGGAAFPAGVKWEAVAKQPIRPHFFICNADESEPGTFKDRVLMEHDPFAVLESLTIAGFATGSEKGFMYIRGEYPGATSRLEQAIERAYAHGFLGADVMGEGLVFDVELRRGAGAYICGEETSLFNSIEGRRGEPRNKPPFPVERGVFGKPTGINNVETLVNVLDVLTLGGEAYAKIGTADSTGPRLFCLSGCVERPGVYEVEHGVTLRELLEMAGGVRGGKAMKAILLGGAAGSFVTPDDLDLRLTFEDSKAAGVTLGSGVVMVFDEDVDLADIVLRIASICGLGQLAANAVDSAIHRLKIFDGGAA
jgi:NADH-quinone oxidoreductase subunit F